MYAAILAGGQGTRLRPVVSDVPKPMAPVAGRPFIHHILDLLALHGISDVVLSVGHLHERIMHELGDTYGRLRLRYAIEASPLGTGGGLRNALRLVERFPAFAVNGDTYLNLDYRGMLRAHEAAKVPLTIAVRRVGDASRHGRMVIKDRRIVAFEPEGRPGYALINAGVYILAENLLDAPGLTAPFSFEGDYLAPRIHELRPLAFETDGYFIDIGVPDSYERAQRELPSAGPN